MPDNNIDQAEGNTMANIMNNLQEVATGFILKLETTKNDDTSRIFQDSRNFV
jgi:predicted pyridoxine 5'-phosphate oxidase superfamily flavin-nucleotide-binding protein